MSTLIEPGIEIDSRKDEAALVVSSVSKAYRLWSSPKERFRYGLWNQIPGWGPKFLRRIADEKKAALGTELLALKDVSFETRPGEVLALLGRNGSGKSTLLQIIAGTLQPSSGHVSVSGRVTALLELGSGFNPEFTGRDNVYLNAAILGYSKEQTDQRYEEIVAFSELKDFMNQPLKFYSSGMAVRLAFAVQVLLEPQILLIDEALAVGDVFFQQKCYSYMRSLIEKGVSVILATHDFNAVQQFCDRALVLRQGEVAFLGDAVVGTKQFRYLVQKSRLVASASGPHANQQRPAITLEKRISWPDDSAFQQINEANLVRSNKVRCIRAALCDQHLDPSVVFHQGETGRLFYEFQFLEDVSWPIFGFCIRDRSGVMMHGKNLLQSGDSMPPEYGPAGFYLRCAIDVAFELSCGEYTIEFGMSGMRESFLKKGERPPISIEEFNQIHEALGDTHRVLSFSVVLPRNYVGLQLPHYGLVNLPGKMEYEFTKG
jgi:lipopolysaccharide transport system ATP-binding protein